jgi:hypothetical protein
MQIPAYQGRPAQSGSAGWVNSYDQPSRGEQLPDSFFDSEINLRNVGPETALLYAVLEDAFVCFDRQFGVRMRSLQRQAAREAEEWFFSDESQNLFSFLSVCAALGLEPEFIRKKLTLRASLSRHSSGKDIKYLIAVGRRDNPPRKRLPTKR